MRKDWCVGNAYYKYSQQQNLPELLEVAKHLLNKAKMIDPRKEKQVDDRLNRIDFFYKNIKSESIESSALPEKRTFN